MKALRTEIYLPSGVLPKATVGEILSLTFQRFHWFSPVRYGYSILKHRLDPRHLDLNAPVAFYERRNVLVVAARTDRDFLSIHPASPDAPPYVGSVTWTTPGESSSHLSWRHAHIAQIIELMRLLGSPLAITASTEDIERKTQRWVPTEEGEKLMFTVRDYSEGLAGLFWRNFYGPPFVRLFGDRLTSLPAEYKRDLGNGIVLVEPYALPGDAGTEEGQARERSLIEHLGPECFYDHQRHTKPTRFPDLSSLPVPRP